MAGYCTRRQHFHLPLACVNTSAHSCNNIYIYIMYIMYIYMYVYISVRHAFPASGGKPRVQNGDSDSYRDAVFELLVQKKQRSGQVYCI